MFQNTGKKMLPEAVPLFPLPNVVLLPGAVLPLHIFEERYRQMTADILRSHRHLAMALLRPGWEKDYYGRPEIEPVVCVGEILSHERLEDGRYNFLLRGHTRAVVKREMRGQPYRLANLEPLKESGRCEDLLWGARQRLMELFASEKYASLPGGRQFKEMISSSVETSTIADVLAFHYLEDVALKQELLADGDCKSRVWRVIAALEALSPTWRNAPVDARMN
jgi:Lon protease-like protein